LEGRAEDLTLRKLDELLALPDKRYWRKAGRRARTFSGLGQIKLSGIKKLRL